MVSKSFQWLLGPRWQLPLLVLPPAWFPSVVGYCQEHCVDQDSKADFKDGKTECWDWLLMSAMDMVWGNDDQRATIYLSLLRVISEKAMATHSSTLAWKVPWREETGGLQFMGLLKLGMTERLYFHFSLSCIGEGNGNPLQYSCPENPRERGA